MGSNYHFPVPTVNNQGYALVIDVAMESHHAHLFTMIITKTCKTLRMIADDSQAMHAQLLATCHLLLGEKGGNVASVTAVYQAAQDMVLRSASS